MRSSARARRRRRSPIRSSGSRTSSSTSAPTSPCPFAEGDGKLRVEQAQVDALERDCDRFNEPLEPLKSFVLPGGTEAARPAPPRANRLPPGRARRARRVAARVNPLALRYLNRSSDLLFILARLRTPATALEAWRLALGVA